MKQCKFCLLILPIDAFHKKQSVCKTCRAIADKGRNRSGAPDNSSPHGKERKRRWNKLHKDPIKQGARSAVKRAVKRGDLIPSESCQACGKSQLRSDGVRAIQAHHEDYTKPLDVIWLCVKCHQIAHLKDTARKSS